VGSMYGAYILAKPVVNLQQPEKLDNQPKVRGPTNACTQCQYRKLRLLERSGPRISSAIKSQMRITSTTQIRLGDRQQRSKTLRWLMRCQ
jgi:hypothetical protein